MRATPLLIHCVTAQFLSMAVSAGEVPAIAAVTATGPLHAYDGAPATPDADDPSIWVHPAHRSKSLIIATIKDGGLIVYNLDGDVVQAIPPPHLPTILPEDPPTPVGVNLEAADPCPESEERNTFGRYNNVDVAYGIRLGYGPLAPRVDVAIVTDRGCDRLRFYAIDPGDTASPLTDITAPDVPRVFPLRFVQPSPLQPSEGPPGLQGNPLDDQDTAYGIGLWRHNGTLYAFVSQRNRSVVSQLRILPAPHGRLSYNKVRTFAFNPTFRLANEDGAFVWTPCREESENDPQSEGIVIDQKLDILYVGFETIGLYKVRLGHHLGRHVMAGKKSLIEPVKSFGHPYWALPDGDEFECEYDPKGTPEPETTVANGSTAFGGRHLEADLEGLAIYYRGHRGGYLIASSQGDSTLQVFKRRGSNRHVASFRIDGVEDTDGLDISSVSLGSAYPSGLLALHNGKAPAPADTSDINGYAYDNSTQFKLVSWESLPPPL